MALTLSVHLVVFWTNYALLGEIAWAVRPRAGDLGALSIAELGQRE